MITIPMNVAVNQESIPLTVSASSVTLEATIGAEYAMVSADTYEGEYEFTPSDEEQTIVAVNKLLLDNIVIHPVPSNYGKIEWNGSYLTVS